MNEAEVLTNLTSEQYEEISSLWNLTGVGNPARGDTLEAVRQTLEHGGRILVICREGKIIGAVWLTHDFRRLYIHHMAVHPDYQSKGFGRLLLKKSLAIASELKLQAKLEVFPDNKKAYALYKSEGFTTLEGYHTLIKRDI